MPQSVTENEHIIKRRVIIYQAGYKTIGSFAEAIDETRQAVSGAIKAKIINYKVYRVMAAKLGVSLADFWPELFCVIPIADDKYTENIVHHDVGDLSQRF